MKIKVMNLDDKSCTEFDSEDVPIYIHKGRVVEDIPRWVKSIACLEKMRKKRFSGAYTEYKRIGDYVIIYRAKKWTGEELENTPAEMKGE